MCQRVRLDVGRIKEQKILFLDPVCFTVGSIAFGTVDTALPECCELSLNAVPRVPLHPRWIVPLNVCGAISSWSYLFNPMLALLLALLPRGSFNPGLGAAKESMPEGHLFLRVIFMGLH